jgi:hypothetical protein
MGRVTCRGKKWSEKKQGTALGSGGRKLGMPMASGGMGERGVPSESFTRDLHKM